MKSNIELLEKRNKIALLKKVFTISALSFGLLFSAQEAGRSGELLKNEAAKNEMQTQKREVLGRKNAEVLDNNNYRNQNKPNINNNSGRRTTTYNWNRNIASSEVFLRIPEDGYFTVEIADQMMSNASGKFRFFDLNAGFTPIYIYKNGYLLYRTRLNIRNNNRMVLDFFSDYGLYLLENVPVRNQTYGFNNWDDVWNNPYGNQNPNNNYGNNAYYGNIMNNQEFANFINTLKRNNNFDDDKTRFINQQARNTSFTSQQIFTLLKTYSFDEKRLIMAKQLYQKCVDKKNFYVIYDAFDFDRSKRELSDYISRL